METQVLIFSAVRWRLWGFQSPADEGRPNNTLAVIMYADRRIA
jgi:hypothetical protein